MNDNQFRYTLMNLTLKFKKEIVDNYSEFPISASEKKWLEGMSRVFLYKELKFNLDKDPEILNKELEKYLLKVNNDKALLSRIVLHALNTIDMPKDKAFTFQQIEVTKERSNEYKVKLDNLEKKPEMRRSPEEFMKDFFNNPNREKISNKDYYINFYGHRFYLLLAKFLEYYYNSLGDK